MHGALSRIILWKQIDKDDFQRHAHTHDFNLKIITCCSFAIRSIGTKLEECYNKYSTVCVTSWSLYQVMEHNRVRRDKERLQAAREFSKLHPRNLKYLCSPTIIIIDYNAGLQGKFLLVESTCRY